MPEGAVELPDGRKVPIKGGRLYSPEVMGPRPDGEITFASVGAGAVPRDRRAAAGRAVREAAPFPKAGEGKVDAQLKIKLPLVSKLDADDVVIEGKAKITDGRFGKVGGPLRRAGLHANSGSQRNSLDAKRRSDRQRRAGQDHRPAPVLGAPPIKQPPIKIIATLDEADRNQLDLDINDVVHGVVRSRSRCRRAGRPEADRQAQGRSDRRRARPSMRWPGPRPPAGRRRSRPISSGTVATRPSCRISRSSGDDIAIEGWIAIGATSGCRSSTSRISRSTSSRGSKCRARSARTTSGSQGQRPDVRRPRSLPLAVLA